MCTQTYDYSLLYFIEKISFKPYILGVQEIKELDQKRNKINPIFSKVTN